jgi:hypothetical protein
MNVPKPIPLPLRIDSPPPERFLLEFPDTDALADSPIPVTGVSNAGSAQLMPPSFRLNETSFRLDETQRSRRVSVDSSSFPLLKRALSSGSNPCDGAPPRKLIRSVETQTCSPQSTKLVEDVAEATILRALCVNQLNRFGRFGNIGGYIGCGLASTDRNPQVDSARAMADELIKSLRQHLMNERMPIFSAKSAFSFAAAGNKAAAAIDHSKAEPPHLAFIEIESFSQSKWHALFNFLGTFGAQDSGADAAVKRNFGDLLAFKFIRFCDAERFKNRWGA